MSRTTLLLTTALVSLGLTAPGFAAAHHVTTAAHFNKQAQPRFLPGAKTVLTTSSFFGTVFSGSFDTYATQSVTVKKGTRTLAMSAMAQYCGFLGSYTAEATDIVTKVDGSYVDGGPFQHGLQTDDYCNADNWQGIWTVGSGTHSVSFSAYILGGDGLLARTTERTDVIK